MSINNLAALYTAEKRYAEAEPLCKRSLAITESSLGPLHPNVAIVLDNLALIYRKTGKQSYAESTQKRATLIRTEKR